MRINRNMSAVLTNNQLKRTENRLSKSMERLSSGFKINSAGDNPSGIAISNKMKAQIEGLDQAETNSSDAISTLNIADGALNEVTSMLQRIHELGVQAANGTYSSDDRKSIQAEVDQLVKEVDRISGSTEYNTKPLLDGTSDVRVYGEHFTRMNVSDSVITGEYEITVKAQAEKGEITVDYSALSAVSLPEDETGYIYINGSPMEIREGMSQEEFTELLRNTAEAGHCDLVLEKDAGGAVTSAKICSRQYGSRSEIEFKVSPNLDKAAQRLFDPQTTAPYTRDEKSGANIYSVVGKDVELQLDKGFTSTATCNADGNHVSITDKDGFKIDFLLDEGVSEPIKLDVTDIGPMTIQLGANEYQTMEVRIPEISSQSMYLDWVDLTSEKGATRSLDIMDDAINYLNEARSRIGAFHNRLEYAKNSLAASQEDMTSAYSNLMDTDMAEEMSTYTQQNVIDQAAVSVLAQANELPDKILSLLS